MGKTYDIERVIICIRGGVADVLEKSDNVTIEIRDYDCDGTDDNRLTKDEQGDMYISSVY